MEWVYIIEQSPLYLAALIFFGFYPMATAMVWMILGLIYFVRRDRPAPMEQQDDAAAPFVSVLIPAYCEERAIGQALQAWVKVDYPSFEIIVISDGSTDDTVEVVKPFLADPRVRLLDKYCNEGKAMALNDALPMAQGELVVIVDSDAWPDPAFLRHMTPHFQSARVAAVAGNPRVHNRRTLLAKLQAVEFSSVIGLLRRAQRTWGRIMCVSGVAGMYRKSALFDVGLLTPGMATEDIDLTWRLQRKFYDIRYEPRAMVWMIVPDRLSVWWRQRRRWALGLGQILRRHVGVLGSWKTRRMYPLYVESSLSILWALTFLSVTAFWVVCYAMGHPPRGGSPIPNLWGMLLFTLALTQLACGVLIDRKYEPGIVRDFPVSIIYPAIYWLLLAATSCVYSVRGLVRRLDLNTPTRWRIEHDYDEH
jgi:poly-beta-1,6-N-acetyl-D-glucosamine synthase